MLISVGCMIRLLVLFWFVFDLCLVVIVVVVMSFVGCMFVEEGLCGVDDVFVV